MNFGSHMAIGVPNLDCPREFLLIGQDGSTDQLSEGFARLFSCCAQVGECLTVWIEHDVVSVSDMKIIGGQRLALPSPVVPGSGN